MGAGDATARDVKLDASGDLALENGDLVLLLGADGIVADVKARLKAFRGEWFLDESIGLPYFDEVLVKRPNLPAIRALFRKELLATPGIADVTSIDLEFEGSTRKATVKFRATTDTGELVSESVEVSV